MAFAFPTATVVGQLYSYGGTTWEWSGSVWNVQPSFGEITVSVSGPSEIDTKSGDLILDSATGDTQIDDNLTVVGTSALNGDVTMGANASIAGTSNLTGDDPYDFPILSNDKPISYNLQYVLQPFFQPLP